MKKFIARPTKNARIAIAMNIMIGNILSNFFMINWYIVYIKSMRFGSSVFSNLSSAAQKFPKGSGSAENGK